MAHALRRAAIALVVAGCVNTDAAVFIDASIANPQLALQRSALATALSGSLSLSLHLGPRASGAATADVEQLSIVSADGNNTLAPTVNFTATPALPAQVAVDSTATVAVAIAAQDNQLPASAAATLCAGAVVLHAVVDDSLRGSAIAIDSAPLSVAGCR